MKRPLSDCARVSVLTAHPLLMLLLVVQGSTLSWLGALLLAPPLPGLMRGRLHTFQWTSLLVAFYCALWLAEGYFDPRRRLLAFGIATVAAVDFVSLLLYVRWRGRERPARGTG